MIVLCICDSNFSCKVGPPGLEVEGPGDPCHERDESHKQRFSKNIMTYFWGVSLRRLPAVILTRTDTTLSIGANRPRSDAEVSTVGQHEPFKFGKKS